MKILTTQQLAAIDEVLKDAETMIKALEKENADLRKKIRFLENDNIMLKNIINPDIMGLDFPNSDERGQGDSDTPDNLSDLFSNF